MRVEPLARSATNRSPARDACVCRSLTADSGAEPRGGGVTAIDASASATRSSVQNGRGPSRRRMELVVPETACVTAVSGESVMSELAHDRASRRTDTRSCRESDTSRGPCPRARRRRRGAGDRRARARWLVPVLDALVVRAAHAGLDVIDDAVGILRARVVARHDREVRAPLGDARPSAGRLPRSRSPPQPNTTMSRLAREWPHRLERALERVGRVRVVAQHRRPLVDHAPAGPAPAACVRSRARDRRRRHPERPRRAPRRRARWSTLKSPIERQLHRVRAAPPATSCHSLPRGV